MEQPDGANGFPKMIRDGCDFFIADPNRTRRTGTTVPALRAAELQTVGIPRF